MKKRIAAVSLALILAVGAVVVLVGPSSGGPQRHRITHVEYGALMDIVDAADYMKARNADAASVRALYARVQRWKDLRQTLRD